MMPAKCHVLTVIGERALLPELVAAELAAGASRRLGRAKQLMPIGGEPLLRRQCGRAPSARVGEVMPILGCDEAQHRDVIVDLPVDARVNDEWEEGLAQRSGARCARRRSGEARCSPLTSTRRRR